MQHLHYKELPPHQPSFASKTALTFAPYKFHFWLKSNFCFLFIHKKLILSAEQYTYRFSHLEILSVYVNVSFLIQGFLNI